MIIELKKGYTIESRYDKFSDSYITRLLDNESKQVGDALSSKDIVGKNQDIKSVRDYFTNYINNKRVEEEIPDEIDYIEPEEEFEEEEDIFEESLNLEDFDSIVKQKARKTKKATRKAKLPALSKMSPIMPDYAKGIDAFNSMQADGNSSMGSTTGSISLGEEFEDRNSLIKELQNMGFNYKFDKYSDKQLFRIYQERLAKLKKLKAQKEKEQKEADLRDQKIENSKDSYFRDGIEFESEEAAKDYFGESMDNKFYLSDMHKAWDMMDPEDEVSIPVTHSNLNESFSDKNTKQFNTITEGLKFFENKHFDEECEDIQLESLFESIRDKLSSDDIKKLGAFMNHAQDADEVVTYMKGLLSEELTAEQKGDLGLLYDEICYNDLEPTFDYTFDEDTGINRDPYNGDKAILSFHIRGDMAELDRIVERIEDRVGNYNFIMVDNDFDIVSRPNGSTWAECYLFITVKADNSIKEDFDLDEFEDNLEREKDYYGEKAQGLKMLAFPLKRKIEKICNDFWADEYATAVDDLNDEISLAYEVDGDWKHDHLRFQNAVLNMLYEEGYDDVNHYEDVIDDDGSDTYKAIHTFEINASKQNQLSESAYTKDELIDKFGTDDLDIINAGNEEDVTLKESYAEVEESNTNLDYLLNELSTIGFIVDEKYPMRDGLFGRKHIQIINPDLITSEETFEEDIKPLVDVLNNIEETFGETARMTYNIGANDDLQVTAGIDVRVK